jgi:hypothetical protein
MIDQLPHFLYFVIMGLSTIGWLALIFFPRRNWANFWFAGLIIPLVLCLIYMYLLVAFWARNPPATFTEFLTLEGVSAMFRNLGLLEVGWINLISMDLVVGAWMARKAAQIGMPSIRLLPCLIVTFVFAGFGFTLFAIMVGVGRGWSEILKFEAAPPIEYAPAVVRAGRGGDV